MLVKMYGNLADSLRISGQPDDAMAALNQAIAVSDASPRGATPDLEMQLVRSITLQKMGDLYEIEKDLDKAFASDSAALELMQAVVDQNPKNAMMAAALARNHSRLGHVAWRQRRFDVAVEHNRKQYEIRRRLSDAEPASTLLRRDLGRAMRQLGLAIYAADPQSSEAVQLLDQSVDLLGKLASDQPDDLSITEELAETLIARPSVRPPKDRELSIADLKRSIELNEHVLSIEPNDSTAHSQILLANESIARLAAESNNGGATTSSSPTTEPATRE
jgi:tetratricopeptide (TPR) repeat protein